MKGNDVIAFQVENDSLLRTILNVALESAIIQAPFSLVEEEISQSIHSNFERNLALGLFQQYSKITGLTFDWKHDEEFHQCQYDFKWGEQPYLIMNKMVRKTGVSTTDYIYLPALVPNRFNKDRWFAKSSMNDEKSSAFLFTFLVNDGVNQSNGVSNYYSEINQGLINWLNDIRERFSRGVNTDAPFTKPWFWREVQNRGGLPQLNLEIKPSLIITGVCKPEHYNFFLDTDGVSEFAYALYTGKWYEVESPGVITFRNGIIRSKFKNATCPLAALPSFSEMLMD